MENRRSVSGSPWERGFELSYRIAREQIAKIADIQEQCGKSGAKYLSGNKIAIEYLNQTYHIVLPDVKVVSESSGTEAPLRDQILMLHYFALARGTPATGRLIAYRQLPGGLSYFPAFSQRAITPLVKNFGRRPELLSRAAARLGGRAAEYGDVSAKINAFEFVPITLVLWKGDEEVAPNGSILFDANICDYLSTEDVTVLCETIIWSLVKTIRLA